MYYVHARADEEIVMDVERVPVLVYRSLGLTDRIREAAEALATFGGMLTGSTLTTADWAEIPKGAMPGVLDMDRNSPVTSVLCPQDVLEPVLADAARERGVDLRFGTEVLDLHQDEDGVTVTLSDRAGGQPSTLRADYVIAADGSRSGIRERLGIPRSGIGHLADNLDVYFAADLGELVENRRFNLCSIENPAASGAFVSVNGTDRWLFSTSNEELDGVRPADYPTERWIEVLRTVIGLPDVDIRIISSMAWESGMYVADRFAEGRVFLAGDAAHVMPPWPPRAPTPPSRTCTTWPGSWPPCWRGGRTDHCWRPTTTSATNSTTPPRSSPAGPRVTSARCSRRSPAGRR
jgi:putative polyketide hydroxylase